SPPRPPVKTNPQAKTLISTRLEIFPDNAGILRIYLLQFSAIVGYKTRRAA
ncbi:hypothetical protein ACUOA8_19805, partial [Escherichia sp. SS-MK2]